MRSHIAQVDANLVYGMLRDDTSMRGYPIAYDGKNTITTPAVRAYFMRSGVNIEFADPLGIDPVPTAMRLRYGTFPTGVVIVLTALIRQLHPVPDNYPTTVANCPACKQALAFVVRTSDSHIWYCHPCDARVTTYDNTDADGLSVVLWESRLGGPDEH